MALVRSLERPLAARALPRVLPRVLIVDDSAVARAALARIVSDSGRYNLVATCANAAQAQARLRQSGADLILLDIDMPGTTGLAAIRDLLREGGQAKILIVSGSAEAGGAHAVEAMALGAADTLEKPSASTIGARFGDLLLAKLDALSASNAAVGGGVRGAAVPASVRRRRDRRVDRRYPCDHGGAAHGAGRDAAPHRRDPAPAGQLFRLLRRAIVERVGAAVRRGGGPDAVGAGADRDRAG